MPKSKNNPKRTPHPLDDKENLETLRVLETKVMNKSHNLATITSLMQIYTVI